ncbi:MAG: ribbon-helix-helix protein, CopG family [Burkholderiales bacterium]
MGDIIRTSFLLPSELQAKLREASQRLGRTQTELVRDALGTYLDTLQPPAPKCIGVGSDTELSGAASERWLAQRWAKKTRK